jgi:hypothetical protein
MKILRYVALLALAVWAGGLSALGAVAAPTLFAALQSQDPIAGREMAGWLFGTIFTRFQYVGLGAGVVLLGTLGARAALGPRPRRFALRMWTVAAMLAVSAVTTFVLAPRIEAIRTSVHAPIASLPETDPRRVTFGELHGASNVLMLFTILAGAALLWAESSDPL